MSSVFFLHLPGNLDLLKAQIKDYPGSFRPSFSTPGLCTFLIDEKAKSALKNNPPSLALCYGFDATRVTEGEASVWCENQELVFSGKENFIFRDPKNNLWQGKSDGFSIIAKLSKLKTPSDSPSRAWLKIAQACELFPRERSGDALEIGCSPGGAAHFLLSQNLKLVGVDPGEMAPEILAHEHFHHIRKPVQDLTPEDLPYKFSLLAVDTNLPASVSVKESLRIAAWSGKKLLEVYLTVKLPTPKLVSSLPRYKKTLEDMGFQSFYVQLPSHHREILLIGQRR